MANTARVHIVKRDAGWAIKKEGKERASSLHDNKQDALRASNSLTKKGFDVIVHNADGSVSKWKKSK
ncbi:MAG: DUF2188 domain-containing protein [Flavobacterium sp.]|nr:DUF2188 domain-containing protein [Flavobacterium sp.]